MLSASRVTAAEHSGAAVGAVHGDAAQLAGTAGFTHGEIVFWFK